MRRLSPLDAAWLLLESRDTPMHVGGLFQFTPPDGAPRDYLRRQLERMRESRALPRPWNLRLVHGPLIGPRLALMRDDHDVDLDYHVRHSALPHPGGQRELGILISRLHSHQLDLNRPLWEMHVIEGLEGGRFAIYLKIHHSLIDGVSGMRLILRALSSNSEARDTPAFWSVGEGSKRNHTLERRDADHVGAVLATAADTAGTLSGLGRAAVDLGRAAIDGRALQAPYRTPDSALRRHLGGQRRFATQQYDLEHIRSLASAADCTVNDIVLYLSGTALRRYLTEHGRLPDRPLTAGIPVSLRDDDDQSTGTAIGILVAQLATNVADPHERLETIKASTAAAKAHLRTLPPSARSLYTVLINGPYIGGLAAGLGGRSPVPFSVGISNVPGPSSPCYLNGSRLDALFPISLLMHGNALNITCVSYAGTLNFGFTGARDTLPHLQRLAIYMGEAVEEATEMLVGRKRATQTPVTRQEHK